MCWSSRARVHLLFYGEGRICCSRKLLPTTSFNETNIDVYGLNLKIFQSFVIVQLLSTYLKIKTNTHRQNADIRYHFLKDLVQKVDNSLEFVSTENQTTDTFIKSLASKQFYKIKREVGLLFSSIIVCA